MFKAPTPILKRRTNTISIVFGGPTPNKTRGTKSSALRVRTRIETPNKTRVPTINMTNLSPEMGSFKRRRSCLRWFEEEDITLIIGVNRLVNRFQKRSWKQ